jgi:hypothetical protein
MVTTLKALINNINQRREMVKEFVVLTEQKEQKVKAYQGMSSNLDGYSTKILLHKQIDELTLQILEKKNIIKQKFNENILKELKELERDQEKKISKFIHALGKSQMSIHNP